MDVTYTSAKVEQAGFLSSLCLKNATNTDDGKWIITEPLSYQSVLAQAVITVQAGFQTDLASVPRIPLVYWLCGGTDNEAAALHDGLYSSHVVPRNVADAIFREASKVTGVTWWRRQMMWAGVRLFGGSHW